MENLNIDINELRTFNHIFDNFGEIEQFCDCRQIDKYELAIICRDANSIDEIDKIWENESYWEIEEIADFNENHECTKIVNLKFDFEFKILEVVVFDEDGGEFRFLFKFSDDDASIFANMNNHVFENMDFDCDYLDLYEVVVEIINKINHKN